MSVSQRPAGRFLFVRPAASLRPSPPSAGADGRRRMPFSACSAASAVKGMCSAERIETVRKGCGETGCHKPARRIVLLRPADTARIAGPNTRSAGQNGS
jgi:hypothetical protein